MKRAVQGTTPAGAYSPGVIAEGRFLYVSGQGPLRDGAVVEGTIEAQTRLVMENLGAILAEAGATYADVVRCGVFLADLDDFEAMNTVYRVSSTSRSRRGRRSGLTYPESRSRSTAWPSWTDGVSDGRTVAELETPALVVDLDRLDRNLTRTAEYTSAHRLEFYPHAKTHKTREIGALQLEHGAAGLTTAKSREAEIFAAALGAPLVLHYPVVGAEKVARLAEVAGAVPLTIALDSAAAAEPIAAAMRSRGTEAQALIEVDVGLRRTGLDPERAVEVGRRIEALGGGLRVAGLSCYPGHLRYDENASRRGCSRSARPSSGRATCSRRPASTARGSRAARPRRCFAPTGPR